MIESELADLFGALNMVVMERLEDGSFRLLGTIPEWVEPFFQSVYPMITSFGLGENCPFLENFLIDAERFWSAKTAGHLKSGLLIAPSPSGDDYALEATAVFSKERKMMLIELCWLADSEKQSLIQKGRELSLDHRRLLRLEQALRQTQNDLQERVEERTAKLSTSNALLQQEIAERKRAEEHLVRLATAIEQAAESIILTDREGNVEYVNPSFEQISGYPREEISGRNIRILKSNSHDDTFYRTMWNTIIQGNVWTGHIISKQKSGALCEFETTISPVRGSSGEISDFVFVNRDVTHEVLLQSQLRQAQKMEVIGTLAGGIAHDFNNILGAILGYTEMAVEDIPKNTSTHTYLKEVLRATLRAKDLVKQILAFSRQGETQARQPIEIAPVIKEALKLLRATFPATIELRQQISAHSLTVMGDPTELHQIVMNLCANAAHAMRDRGGILEVTIGEVELDAASAEVHENLQPGSYVQLTVRDTGHGMDAATLDRIFDPYFTTKGVSEGSGLGLAVVRGIVKRHEGAISVRSKPERGTVFEILFPRIEKAQEQPENEFEPLTGGTEHILFVDDEEPLATLGEWMLVQLGYRVTARTNSLEAMELFRSEPDAFDLVITDYTMPNMTGVDLAKAMLQIRPDIPIVLCTGYSEMISEDTAKEMGIRAFVMKPVLRQNIARVIRKVLNEETP
jgi:PAS domain S-box-containing protein